jgi:hypothetical protein
MDQNTAEFDLYINGRDYNNKLNPPYYPTVDKNYRFYGTDHWRGVQANGNPTPVFPIIKQIVDYKISSIISSRTKMQFSVENVASDTEDQAEQEYQKVADLISGYSETKWEKLKMDSLIREALLKGAVTGDMCFYTYWDPTIDSGSTSGMDPQGKPVKVMGDFVTEVISGANVMFGNPNDRRAQKQPYILIGNRDLVSNLKAKAKANKIPQLEIDKISADTDTQEMSGERGKVELDGANNSDSGKCLYLIKLWKDNGKVMMKIVTKSAIVQKDTDTGLTLYPIAWGNWDLIENSYHGQAEVTGIVPNQILVNQLAANIAIYMRGTAFGKIIYDKTRIAGWDNRITGAIGVEGDITGAVQQINPGQMNNMVMTFFERVVQLTKDIAGANDSALGNESTRNATALIANQRQAAVPLEAIKDRLYQVIEDLGLIWLDFILNKYGIDRKVSFMKGDKTQVETLNGSLYKDVPFKLKIDVGASSYWSSVASMQTLDNLLQQQKITFVQYLERVEGGLIPKVHELINEIKSQAENKPPVQDIPKLTIAFTDMPAAAQIQALALAGINVQPQDMVQTQQQQIGKQTQALADQTQKLQDAHRQLTYEQMHQFMKTLAPDIQEALKQQKGNLNPQQGGASNGDQQNSNV